MTFGAKNFCCALSSVLFIMAALASVAAVQSGSRVMYIQTAICGILGAAVTIAVLVRL